MTSPKFESNYFLTEDGNELHYTTTGYPSGPLLIALHGLGGSTETYPALIPHLQVDKYRIVSLDFDGFGKSSLPDTELSISRYVANLDRLISHLRVEDSCEAPSEPVIVIGHSLGAVVALHYAAHHPENVAGLGLLGANRSASHIEAARERMLGMAKKVRSEGIEVAADLAVITNLPEYVPEAWKKQLRDRVAACDPEAYARTCEAAISSSHVDPDYNRILCPTVFVTGDQDIISTPEKAKDISGLIKGPSEVFVVKGGHQPILNDLEGTSLAMKKLFEMLKA